MKTRNNQKLRLKQSKAKIESKNKELQQSLENEKQSKAKIESKNNIIKSLLSQIEE